MRKTRELLLLATLGFTVLLTVLSVVGAFLGADAASDLFNSRPLVVVWILITALFLAGFVYFKSLVRSPGGLMCHLGVLLVLVGAMYGSRQGHAMTASYLGIDRTREGYMQIFEGQASSTISDGADRPIGTLPFRVGLEDFWIEYYGDAAPWRLGVDAPPHPGSTQRRVAEIHWHEGVLADIPFLEATVEIIQYLPSARARYPDGAIPTLEVVEADGHKSVVPARVGEELKLSNGEQTLRVARIFGHLQIRDGEVVDIPGSDANPAIQLLLEAADGTTSRRYAFARSDLADHNTDQSGLQLNYAMPTELVAVADATTKLPAMEVRVHGAEGEEMHGWLIARSAQQPAALALTGISGGGAPSSGGARGRTDAYLVLAGVQGMISDYKSRLTVLDDADGTLAEKVIEVNDPLHHGGYHFYQHSYDSHGGRYTILGVHSDAGLNVVYLGFALLCLGVTWLFWVVPVWRSMERGA